MVQKQIKKDVQAINNNNRLTASLIVDADDVKAGKGGRGSKGEKYPKYRLAIAPHVQWLKDRIAESKDGIIRVRTKDIAQQMGSDFAKKSHTAIYWGLRYVLFKMQIIVGSGETDKKEKILTMRMRTDSDRLPPSLEKEYLKELDSIIKAAPKVEITKTEVEWVSKSNRDNPDSPEAEVETPKVEVDTPNAIGERSVADLRETNRAEPESSKVEVIKSPKRLITAIRLNELPAEKIEGEVQA